MRRIVVLASLSLLALTAVPADAGVVSVLDNDFDPLDHVLTAPGQLVTWDWATGVDNFHNVRQRERLFSSGQATADDDATSSTSSESWNAMPIVAPYRVITSTVAASAPESSAPSRPDVAISEPVFSASTDR